MTSGVSTPTNPGSTSRGYAWVPVTVQSIDGNTATVIDTTTQTRQVSITNMPAKGVPPKPGEQWLIHRQYGAWTFGLCLNTPTAIQEADITGLVDDLAALNTRTHLLGILLGNAATEYVGPSGNPPSTASTGFVDVAVSSAVVGVPFITPPSGKVSVAFGIGVNASTGTATVSMQIAKGAVVGTGDVALAASDGNSFASTSSNTVPGERRVGAISLTPNTEYNAYLMWHSSSTSISITGSHPWLEVTPLLA